MPEKEVVIGRVAVKVLPDTDDFRDRLKVALTKLQAQLDKDPLKVGLEIETDNIAEKVKAATASAKKAADEVVLRVDLDGEQSVRKGIAQLERELEKLRETEINVGLNEDDLDAARSMLQERLDEVSRVKLSVDPSSQKSIERSVQQLDRELEKFKNIEINVETDEDSLRTARNNLQKELDKIQYSLDHEDALKMNIDRDTANRVNRDVQAALNRVRFDPAMDSKQIRKGLRDIERHMLKIADLRMSITPEMNEREKREVYREIEDLEDRVEEIKSSVEPDVSQPHRWGVLESLARLTRPRTVHIIPIVSRLAAKKAAVTLAALAGARSVTKILDDLWSSLQNLDKNIPIIGSLTLALLGLGSLGLTTASNLFALSESLAQIVPAGLALPGILGGLAIGVGATVAVFKDFNKELPQVGRNFKKLQNAMSEDFWSRAKAPIKEMIDVLFPQFADGMEEVAMNLGTFFANVADSMREKFSHSLDGMFNNLELSILIASRYTDDYIGIIDTLGRKGSERLPGLAKWFGEISDQFDNFLTAADKDGRLDQWIDTGIFMMKELGEVIKQTGRIFYGLAQAAEAAGGSTLSMLADTLENVANVVNGPTFQKALTGVFEAAHEAISIITEKSGPEFKSFMLRLATVLQRVLPIMGSTLGTAFEAIFSALDQPAVQRGVIKMFRGLESAIEALAPAMPSVGKAFGSLMEIIGTLAAAIGPVLAVVFEALADALVQVTPALKDAIEALGGALLKAVEKLAPLVPVVADALVWMLEQIAAHPYVAIAIAGGLLAMSAAFSAISSLLGPLMPMLGSLITTMLPGIIGGLSAAWPYILAAAAAFAAAAAAIGGLIAGIVIGIAEVPELRATLKDFWENVLVPIGKEIWKQAKENWPAIKESIISLKDSIVEFWQTAQPHLQEFVDFLKAHMPEIREAIRFAFGFMTNQLKFALDALTALVDYATFNVPGIAAVIDVLGEVTAAVFNFSKNAPLLLYNAGFSIIEGLVQGMADAVPLLTGHLRFLTKLIPDEKGPASKDKVLLFDAGSLIMRGLVSGMESETQSLMRYLGGVTHDISGSLNSAASARIDVALAESGGAGAQNGKTLNYYAAPNNSLDSEEDLFAAADRSRMVDW